MITMKRQNRKRRQGVGREARKRSEETTNWGSKDKWKCGTGTGTGLRPVPLRKKCAKEAWKDPRQGGDGKKCGLGWLTEEASGGPHSGGCAQKERERGGEVGETRNSSRTALVRGIEGKCSAT